MATQLSKADKHLCQIHVSIHMTQLINSRKMIEGRFKEDMFEEALMQLLRPYFYQIGIGHKDFKFRAPLKRGKDTKVLSFWVPVKVWEHMNRVSAEEGVMLNAIIYTALHNYFVLPTKAD